MKGALRVGATIAGGTAAGKEVDKLVEDDSNSIRLLREQLADLAEEIKVREKNSHEKSRTKNAEKILKKKSRKS